MLYSSAHRAQTNELMWEELDPGLEGHPVPVFPMEMDVEVTEVRAFSAGRSP